ncbi:MAG: AAA family ATPase [Candidatus Thiodiazotropha sp.]
MVEGGFLQKMIWMLFKMRISQIDIKNFRCVKEGKIFFDNHTVLVGANSSGKTSVIEALAVLFGRDRLVRNLTEHDFYGAMPAPEDRFYIKAVLTDFEPNTPDAHDNWFRMGRGIPKWINPDDQSINAEKQQDNWKLCIEIGVAGRFDHEDLEVELRRYFVDSENLGDPFDDEYTERFPSSMLKDSGFFLVPASRTWDKMLSFSSELFRRVVSTVGAVPAQAIMAERDQLRDPAAKLEEQPEVRTVFDEVNNELALLFSDAPKSLLRLTATNSEAILNTLVPHFSKKDEQLPPIPANRQGSGIVSMQNLLLLLQLGKLREQNGQSFFVAIEEPELHIPPSQQRRLTNRLKACCEQTIVTTHSPTIAAEFEPHAIRILENKAGVLSARPLMQKPLGANDTNPIRQLIQWQRSDAITALMHERLLIPEGKADCNWIKKLCIGLELHQEQAHADGNLFSTLIGVFPTDSAQVAAVSEVMSMAHANVFCLVDGDQAGTDYITKLKALAQPPKRALRWPNNWTIEDVIGSLLKADEVTFLPQIKTMIGDNTLANVDAFITQVLKNGGKGDYLLHEQIVQLLFTTHAGINAVSALLSSIIDATKPTPSGNAPGFVQSALSNGQLTVLEYQP